MTKPKAKEAKPAAKEKAAKAKDAPKKSAAKPADKKPAKAAKPDAKPAKPQKPAKPSGEQKTQAPGIGFAGGGLGIGVSLSRPRLMAAAGTRITGRIPDRAAVVPQRPSERRLSKKELEGIKVYLLERQEKLIAGLNREKGMQSELSEQRAADEVDIADKQSEQDMSFEIASAKNQELKDIRIALDKIENGTYGKCEICGCDIPPTRLKVLPSATTCRNCRGQEEVMRRREEAASVAQFLGGDESEAGPEI